MSRKNIFLVVCILYILAFLLTGCKGLKFLGKDKDAGYIVGEDLYKGTDGLDVSFVKESLPKDVFENNIFRVQILLQNKGAYDIKNGYVALSYDESLINIKGPEDLYFTTKSAKAEDNQHIRLDIKGRSVRNPNGDIEIATIRASSLNIDTEKELEPANFYTTACYPYKTKASAEVCIDAHTYQEQLKRLEKPCEVREIGLSSQGSPVSVISIIPTMLPHESDNSLVVPQFIVNIQNNGKGNVFGLEDSKDTPKQLCYNEIGIESIKDEVKVKAFFSGSGVRAAGQQGISLDCDASIIKLDEKTRQGSIICRHEKGIPVSDGVYLSPMLVELDYGYMESSNTIINVKNVPSAEEAIEKRREELQSEGQKE